MWITYRYYYITIWYSIFWNCILDCNILHTILLVHSIARYTKWFYTMWYCVTFWNYFTLCLLHIAFTHSSLWPNIIPHYIMINNIVLYYVISYYITLYHMISYCVILYFILLLLYDILKTLHFYIRLFHMLYLL